LFIFLENRPLFLSSPAPYLILRFVFKCFWKNKQNFRTKIKHFSFVGSKYLLWILSRVLESDKTFRAEHEMSYLKKMNFLKKRKNQKTNAIDNLTRQRNDEEINNLLDPSKLAASLNLKSSTIKFNYFFDDSDIFRVWGIFFLLHLFDFKLNLNFL